MPLSTDKGLLPLRSMIEGRNILPAERFGLTLDRLCHQLIENYDDFEGACIIGVQPRGTLLADRIYAKLTSITGLPSIAYGKLDITFYRDDFRHREKPLRASTTEIDFLVEGKKVILIDDVLYTGRTIHAAMSALLDFGRPEKVELLVLVDRRFNRELPIRSDYTGIRVDALDEAYVRVDWGADDHNQVLLFPHKAEV
ncbi:MAG: bifunctional pyr operon transcriptional regulator/uracil phosphoribosyltransferase PyrR [Saprospiraceae bacterium]